MNAKDIKSHIWITYQGAEGVMARIKNPYEPPKGMLPNHKSKYWDWEEKFRVSFPILNTTEINLEIQGEDLEYGLQVWVKDHWMDLPANSITSGGKGKFKHEFRHVLRYTPKQAPKIKTFKITKTDNCPKCNNIAPFCIICNRTGVIHTPVEQTPKADSEKCLHKSGTYINNNKIKCHDCGEIVIGNDVGIGSPTLSKVDNHIGETETHIRELYAENKKLSNLLKLVLDIDALTTTEFCDMYRKDYPTYKGVVDLAVMEMFAVDSHKWHLIKDRAKEIKKSVAYISDQHPDLETVDSILEYVSDNVDKHINYYDGLLVDKAGIKSMRDDILKELSK